MCSVCLVDSIAALIPESKSSRLFTTTAVKAAATCHASNVDVVDFNKRVLDNQCWAIVYVYPYECDDMICPSFYLNWKYLCVAATTTTTTTTTTTATAAAAAATATSTTSLVGFRWIMASWQAPQKNWSKCRRCDVGRTEAVVSLPSCQCTLNLFFLSLQFKFSRYCFMCHIPTDVVGWNAFVHRKCIAEIKRLHHHCECKKKIP